MTAMRPRDAASPGPAAVWLAAGLAAIGFIWCGMLPRLLRYGPVARHIDLMEQLDVNPAAMYYTELDRLPLRPEWVAQRLTLWPALSAWTGLTSIQQHFDAAQPTRSAADALCPHK